MSAHHDAQTLSRREALNLLARLERQAVHDIAIVIACRQHEPCNAVTAAQRTSVVVVNGLSGRAEEAVCISTTASVLRPQMDRQVPSTCSCGTRRHQRLGAEHTSRSRQPGRNSQARLNMWWWPAHPDEPTRPSPRQASAGSPHHPAPPVRTPQLSPARRAPPAAQQGCLAMGVGTDRV